MSHLGTVYVVDDDRIVRESLTALLRLKGLPIRNFSDARVFLEACPPTVAGCLIADVRMPGLSGLELQRCLRERDYTLPMIVFSGHADVPMAVRALKAGALDFLEKPFEPSVLVALIDKALALDARRRRQRRKKAVLEARFGQLSESDREILRQIVQGRYNKVIAADLGISVSTVEAYRKKLMGKLHAKSIYDLVRIAESNLDLGNQGLEI